MCINRIVGIYVSLGVGIVGVGDVCVRIIILGKLLLCMFIYVFLGIWVFVL